MMRTWVLRFRATDNKGLDDIRGGRKTIETRAATERYRKIKAGDRLVFVCRKSRLQRTVKRTRHFYSIGTMLRAINYKKIMPSTRSADEARKIYYGYSGYKEKIRRFGIIAFWL